MYAKIERGWVYTHGTNMLGVVTVGEVNEEIAAHNAAGLAALALPPALEAWARQAFADKLITQYAHGGHMRDKSAVRITVGDNGLLVAINSLAHAADIEAFAHATTPPTTLAKIVYGAFLYLADPPT